MKQQSIAPLIEVIEKQNDPVMTIVFSVASGLIIAFTIWLIKKSRGKL